MSAQSAPARADTGAVADVPETARPLLLFFRSPTSGPCRRVEAYLAQILQRHRNHDTFRVFHIDAEQRPDMVERMRVKCTPTLVVLEDGQARARLAGPCGCKEIADLLAPWLKVREAR